MSMHPLQHWIPYRLLIDKGDVRCRWLYVGEQRFDAPFFDETQQQCMQHPYNSSRFRSETSLDSLIELAQFVPAVLPTAFIFHVSRCGSTLLSQLLTLGHHRIVLSEVPLLDELLRLPEQLPAVSPIQQEQAILAAIRLLGQRRTNQERELFIKFDSWHIGFSEMLRRLFPDVPVILLYRSPGAVVQSHRKQRGMHAVPGLLPPALFDLRPTAVPFGDADAYTALVLTYYYRQFLRIAEQDEQTLLLAYQSDGLALLASMMTFLGIPIPTDEWAILQQRSSFHAKRPGQVFREALPDEPLTPWLLDAQTAFEHLENKRLLRTKS